ncbi:flagellar motor protein [Thioflavicoccus mobilis 8321]|uniref:Flagellar motor protein n=1 Tax=Thioflavicoccus mobilis 8321 TaxID=765912 RepID=L0GQZ0_9GAMM|nr:MotB family protein [Thioflavicoccus mobilis]AGA89163.1 flagellar motor protein [Thioflavicoccus mobilis 8321]
MSNMLLKTNSPGWMATFADLMALLLAFFVLLFSFSELDKAKYKEVAGSMRDAFGVQREIRVREPPKGLNVIAREFSPGITQETVRNQVRQFTTSDSLPYPVLFKSNIMQASTTQTQRFADQRMLADRRRLEQALRKEIDDELIELEVQDNRIVVRLKEKGAFPSGSDKLIRSFEPILVRLGDVLIQTSGEIVVAGHTDDIPIENVLFRSNWELSMARALTVAKAFFARSTALEKRTHLEAHAEFQPVDTNETSAGRARNRRVEISLIYRDDSPGDEASAEGRGISQGLSSVAAGPAPDLGGRAGNGASAQ